MNTYEISEVRRTWALASRRMPLLTELFCARLRLLDKQQRAMFGDDAKTNSLLVLRLVNIAVNGLNQPRILFPLLETLGREYAGRIPKARQHKMIIQALFGALQATIGVSLNSSARHAWIACYRAVTQAISKGMAGNRSGRQWAAKIQVGVLVDSSCVAQAASVSFRPLQIKACDPIIQA